MSKRCYGGTHFEDWHHWHGLRYFRMKFASKMLPMTIHKSYWYVHLHSGISAFVNDTQNKHKSAMQCEANKNQKQLVQMQNWQLCRHGHCLLPLVEIQGIYCRTQDQQVYSTWHHRQGYQAQTIQNHLPRLGHKHLGFTSGYEDMEHFQVFLFSGHVSFWDSRQFVSHFYPPKPGAFWRPAKLGRISESGVIPSHLGNVDPVGVVLKQFESSRQVGFGADHVPWWHAQ